MGEGEKELPLGWANSSSKELLSMRMGKTILSKELSERGIAVFSAGISQEPWGYIKASDLIFTKGTIILAARGNIGFPVLPKLEKFISTQTTIAVSVSPAFLPQFLNYYFRVVQWSKYTSTTAIPMLTIGAANKIPLIIPPLAEQERIVDKIDELFSSIEAGERAIARARTALTRYRKAVLKAAVTGELTADWRLAMSGEVDTGSPSDIAQNKKANPPTETAEALLKRILKARYEAWEKTELEKLDAKGKTRPKTDKEWVKFRSRYKEPVEADTNDLPDLPKGWFWVSPVQIEAPEDYALAIGPFGSNLKVSDYTEEGVPLIFVRHIRSGNFANDKPKFVSKEKANTLKAHSASAGDLLITKMGEPPGEARIYPARSLWAIITADCIKWTLSPILNGANYFEICVNSVVVSQQIKKITRGVAQQKVSLARFRSLAIPLPPLEEQAEIVSRVEEALSKADKVEATLDAQARSARALKQAVLKTAFEGRLVPQNPNDEPASELLKRIKAAS